MKLILRIVSKITFILVLALIIVFCINNNVGVKISLIPFPFEIETKLFILVLLCFFGGILVGFTLSSISLFKEKFKNFVNRWQIKLLQRKVEKAELKIEKKVEKRS